MKIRTLALLAITVFIVGLATQMAPVQSVPTPTGTDLTTSTSP